MIDLHTHTNQSDGTYSPEELVQAAAAAGLEALAITDHDTFAGHDQAVEFARAAGLNLVCGIELSTKFNGSTVHLLGYFLRQPPSAEFRDWLSELQRSRVDRNRRLVERLRSLGVEITLEEVQAKGRSLTGRPHFAQVLVEKGYVRNYTEAFDEYLDESAKGFVEREEPQLAMAIEMIRRSDGVPSVAHPIRLARGNKSRVDGMMTEMRDAGLLAIEVYHSDHGPADVEHYRELGRKLGLRESGGSDFHGGNKPNIRLGTGLNGNLEIPMTVLERLQGSS